MCLLDITQIRIYHINISKWTYNYPVILFYVLHTCELLETKILAIRKKINLKESFIILNTSFIFVYIGHLTAPFGKGWVPCRPSVSFVCAGLLVWTFSQLHKLNITYCLKSSLLLAIALCFFFCMVDQSQT